MKAILLPILFLLQNNSAIRVGTKLNLSGSPQLELAEYFDADMGSMAQLEASIEKKESSDQPKEAEKPQFHPLEKVFDEMDQPEKKSSKKVNKLKKKTQSLVQSKLKSHQKTKTHSKNKNKNKNANKSKDDPIFGSLGPPPINYGNNTGINDEINFENEMRRKVPISFTDAKGVVETEDSLKWAEKELNTTLILPRKGAWEIENGLSSDASHNGNGTVPNITFEEDEDVSSTLDSIKDAEQIWGYYDKYYYNHPWGLPESYPGAPTKPSYGYGYGRGNSKDKNGDGVVDEKDDTNGDGKVDEKDGNSHGGGRYGGYGGYGRWGRRYSWDDRGGVDRNRGYGGYYGNQGSDGPKNKDWWNYLTKDNGQDGMVPVMLNKTQLESEGFYNDIWWLEHGVKDDQGRLVKDRNGKPKIDISDKKHEQGRDAHHNHEGQRNETLKKNFDKNSQSTNGHIPKDILPEEEKNAKAVDKKEAAEACAIPELCPGGAQESEEHKEERRAKDKKSEKKEEKKDDAEGDKEEKGDSKESDSDKKEPEKEEAKTDKKEEKSGEADHKFTPDIESKEEHESHKEEAKASSAVQSKSKSLKEEIVEDLEAEKQYNDDNDDEEWTPEHPSISESVKLIPKEAPAPVKKAEKPKKVDKKEVEKKIDNKQTEHQKQFSEKKAVPKKEEPKKRVMVVDGAEIPMDDVEDPEGTSDVEIGDELSMDY